MKKKRRFPRVLYRVLFALLLIVSGIIWNLWTILFVQDAIAVESSDIETCVTDAVSESNFLSPPDSARPWVYWFIMDGNLTKEGITADFEAMRDQGIGGFVMMEVNCGVPRGPIDFMSDQWQKLFVHIVREAERCGLQMTLPSGPGWAGSGGPWITPEHSMWHLVAAQRNVFGPMELSEILPTPQPRVPFFGEGVIPPDQEKARKAFFQDVRVIAFPTPQALATIDDIDEKANYVRSPYSSVPNVKPRIPAPAKFPEIPTSQTIDSLKTIDLTEQMDSNGQLQWNVPPGNWTILRFAATSTGANTRPAPTPGMGLESSKFDRDAFDIHAANYIDKLLDSVGDRQRDGKAGWCYFHIDSWEMGPQNYSPKFFQEFEKRRGYDPIPWLPAYTGRVVNSVEMTERFLWDLRQTSQELILENHAEYLRDISHRHNLKLSLEFYDMMPCCDMTFGAVADVPMCEFWANSMDTTFSGFEAASIANTHGKSIVAAEAFTSFCDQWRNNPKSMKQQTDWAFCTGINRLTFHRFQHQPYLDKYPGFSMGNIGSHWERTQTWWPLSLGYHTYLARCQYLLRQGNSVVDLLYLLPEGAPQVFTPPASALMGSGIILDQRGYRFDGCDPDTLLKLATVENGEIIFPNATRYQLLILPDTETMTLPLLEKIEQLVQNGATVVGPLPHRSPSLEGYPFADQKIQNLVQKIIDNSISDNELHLDNVQKISYGNGTIYLTKEQALSYQKPLVLESAQWIWFPEKTPSWDASEGARYFRRSFSLNHNAKIQSARMVAVADNDVIVTVNGQEVYRANLQDPIQEINIVQALKMGENLLEITAINGVSSERNPAGFLAFCEIEMVDSSGEKVIVQIPTDHTWESSMTPTSSGDWRSAIEMGNYGISPWGNRNFATFQKNIYPEYSVTETILSQRNIAPDFTSKNDALRFYHRRDQDIDYYFISNRLTTPYEDDVTFRVTGKHAIILEPMTGRIFRTEPCTEQDGVTRTRLTLAGSESIFVLFSDQKTLLKENSKKPVWYHAKQTSIMDLNDHWSVQFDAQKGGLNHIVHFDHLVDWTQREEPEIRYYSGIATYERKFSIDRTKIRDSDGTEPRLFLDLGDVNVMAEVSVNQKPVGICWTSPYRLEITDLLQDGENTLTISVANLWSNRLIGDAALPENERITWSTWPNGGYQANDPLLPSGLIGPVQILRDLPTETEKRAGHIPSFCP